jgi:uncharacterized protein YhfF
MLPPKPRFSPLDSFWQAYLSTLPQNHPHHLRPMPATWAFGNSPEMADELGHLVMERIKTATCSLLWEHDFDGEPLPEVGELSIILDGDENPICLIETVEIEIRPYNEVDERFAHDEGEGDRSLDHWRKAHWNFFTRVCAQIGRTPAGNMPLVCERFRVLYPVQQPASF